MKLSLQVLVTKKHICKCQILRNLRIFLTYKKKKNPLNYMSSQVISMILI